MPRHRAAGPTHKSDDVKPRARTKQPASPTSDLQRAVESAGGALSRRGAAELQRLAGNRATRTIVQAKLTVGAVGDAAEQQAERVASRLMRDLQRQPEEEELMASRLQRQPEEEELMASRLQRQPEEEELMASRLLRQEAGPMVGMEGGPLDADTDHAIQRAKGQGKPLDAGLRRSMEEGLGADFSAVRVHDDAGAHELNERIQAKAFTTGSDVFFRRGAYDPSSAAGKRLVAHELTHVVQQGAGGSGADVSAKRVVRRRQMIGNPKYTANFTGRHVRAGAVSEDDAAARILANVPPPPSSTVIDQTSVPKAPAKAAEDSMQITKTFTIPAQGWDAWTAANGDIMAKAVSDIKVQKDQTGNINHLTGRTQLGTAKRRVGPGNWV